MLYERTDTVLERHSAIRAVLYWYGPLCYPRFFCLSDVAWVGVDGNWKRSINYTNKLGSRGRLAGAFHQLLHDMWGGDLPYLTPIEFRVRLNLSVLCLFSRRVTLTTIFFRKPYAH